MELSMLTPCCPPPAREVSKLARRTLWMRFAEGITRRQIADEIGCTRCRSLGCRQE
jgi:DNA-binding transcriptional regulator LsrR (DeoR family)